MTELNLTAEERDAFHQDITLNRALDYFFVFDNVPLQFIYRDKLNAGELTDLEQRNKVITETLWLETYHQYLVCNVPFMFTYRGGVLQMPLQIHVTGAGRFTPPAKEERPFLATAEEVRASFDTWMADKGWQLADELRGKPAVASWQTLVRVPDRTSRIVSIMPVGNQVIMELIKTWTVEGKLTETAWVVVLMYDVDGSIIQDRSYIDMANWPSGPRFQAARARSPQPDVPTPGIMDGFYDYQRSHATAVEQTDLETRNLAIVEGAWVDALHNGPTMEVFHADRFRLQLPQQACSCDLATAMDLDAMAKEAAPDRTVRLGMTYAKGNQVVAEGVFAWTKDGVANESAFISFLLLDEDGLIIRERIYPTMDNLPGGDKLAARLGLRVL